MYDNFAKESYYYTPKYYLQKSKGRKVCKCSWFNVPNRIVGNISENETEKKHKILGTIIFIQDFQSMSKYQCRLFKYFMYI